MIAIRFDGPPGPKAGRFIEVERDGKSISFGKWVQDGDDWLLVLKEVDEMERQLSDGRRIALFYGIVGDYDGAYEEIPTSKYDDPENSLGVHESNWPGEGYTIVQLIG